MSEKLFCTTRTILDVLLNSWTLQATRHHIYALLLVFYKVFYCKEASLKEMSQCIFNM